MTQAGNWLAKVNAELPEAVEAGTFEDEIAYDFYIAGRRAEDAAKAVSEYRADPQAYMQSRKESAK